MDLNFLQALTVHSFVSMAVSLFLSAPATKLFLSIHFTVEFLPYFLPSSIYGNYTSEILFVQVISPRLPITLKCLSCSRE